MTIHVPQPIFVHSNSPNNYPPQTFQQPTPAVNWLQETHPMLPTPSAPPPPIDDYLMERPPPYEQICQKI